MNKNNNNNIKEKKSEQPQLVEFVVTARKYATRLTKKHMMRKPWVKPIEEEIRASLPGTVLSVNVKCGDEVKAGDLLLVHEAMKMKNQVRAPFDGIIKAVHVTADMRIKKDFVMIEFE